MSFDTETLSALEADFHRIGYERRDACTKPPAIIIERRQHVVSWHRSGERHLRVADIDVLCANPDEIAKFNALDAFILGGMLAEHGRRQQPQAA